MQLAYDTHVHLYPGVDPGALFDAAVRHLRRQAPAANRFILCLTERAGVFAYEALKTGRLAAPGWRVTPAADPLALHAVAADGALLDLLPGRQIITAERLEILALGADLRMDDGLPAREALGRVREAGAIPVLPWGLGKWLGTRGRLVRQLVDESTPGTLALGDTLLLPRPLPRPAPLRAAARRGFRVLAGSDPLGRPGEENLVGRYGVCAESAFDPDQPARSLLHPLRDPTVPLRLIGQRGSLLECLRRIR